MQKFLNGLLYFCLNYIENFSFHTCVHCASDFLNVQVLTNAFVF